MALVGFSVRFYVARGWLVLTFVCGLLALSLETGRRLITRHAGVFLFLPLLARLRFDQLIERAGYPGTQMVPGANALLSLLTLNGLCCAHGVIVPMQCEYFALEGLSDLVNTIKQVHANLNRELQTIGNDAGTTKVRF